jgi:hypothetical protein
MEKESVMSQDNIKLEKLLEWVASDLYIARKDRDCVAGQALTEWEQQKKRVEEKIEGLREGL